MIENPDNLTIYDVQEPPSWEATIKIRNLNAVTMRLNLDRICEFIEGLNLECEIHDWRIDDDGED